MDVPDSSLPKEMITIVIVEGPDGAGKTRLVRQLRQTFDLEEGKRGTTDRSLLYTVTQADTLRALGGAVLGYRAPLIWDRLFYSEMVYAPATGREPQFNATERQYVSRVIEAIRCPVILCLPPLQVVLDNVERSKDDQRVGNVSVADKAKFIYEKYLHRVDDLLPENTIFYDYSAPVELGFYATVLREINDYLEERREREWKPL